MPAGEPIDPIYLPYPVAELKRHFAPVHGDNTNERTERHLDHYLTSAANRARRVPGTHSGEGHVDAHEERLVQQMEKDERFWVVAALMGLFHHGDRIDNFSRALEAAQVAPTFGGHKTWHDALGDPEKLELYFEAHLPSPPGYSKLDPTQLQKHLNQKMLAIPHLLEKAATTKGLEGTTKVDALLISRETHTAVLFEAKVLADMSVGTSYDITRNQMLRNIDVMLEGGNGSRNLEEPLKSRDPDKTCFVLLTPEVFRRNKSTRLYGLLYDLYKQNPGLLEGQLDRDDRAGKLSGVHGRLGWLTWEDCYGIDHGACPWLNRTNSSFLEH